MIKDFQDIIVLTAQNPDAFINFRHDAGDEYIIPVRDENIGENILIVNGLDIGSTDPSVYAQDINYALRLNSTDNMASFHIKSVDAKNFNKKLSFNIYSDLASSPTSTIDVSIYNNQLLDTSQKLNLYDNAKIHINDDTSFMLLRTNPKFTGNIKLVIDSSNHLYLDTFKISDELNNKKYRHQRVSSESVLSGDIKRVFGSMPESQLYKLDDEVLNISLPKTDLNDQYNQTYNYGAELFKDDLYPDDFALLAPLWVNNKLPDYFTIFRVEGTFNEESYDGNGDESILAKQFIQTGELIKTWGIKETTPMGTYLRNHLTELNTANIDAPLFLPLSDPDLLDPDYNTWSGISWKTGIMTNLNEHPYSFNKLDNYTQINNYLSTGFERLGLLSPNIINMEYAFSDDDASLYSMYRYYGLYLSDNELFKVAYYSEEPDGSISVISLDGKDLEDLELNNRIFDVGDPVGSGSGDLMSDYENRIFALTDLNSVNRIGNNKQINGEDKEFLKPWHNKPGENLFSAKVDETSSEPFITFKINNKLNQGEHLRVIQFGYGYSPADRSLRKRPIYFEVYGSDSDIYGAGECSEYCSTSGPKLVDTSNNPEYLLTLMPIVYRACFSTKGEISDQVRAIKNAFDLFEDYTDTPFETSIIKTDDGQLSITVKKEYADLGDFNITENPDGWSWQFERLTSNTKDVPSDASSNWNSSAGFEDLTFFGVCTPDSSSYNVVDSYYNEDVGVQYYLGGPLDFELYGARQKFNISFERIETEYVYSLNDKFSTLFTDNVMYIGYDKWYRLVKPFTINGEEYLSITDPNELNDNHIIKTSNKIQTVNGNWNAYNIYPLSISLMGINSVKDIDYTVNDSCIGYKSDYWYKREDDLDSTVLTIESGESKYIKDPNSYVITSGTFTIYTDTTTSGKPGKVNDVDPPIYFNTFGDGNGFLSGGVDIHADTTTTIKYAELDGVNEFKSYDETKSEETLNDYYVDPSIKNTLKYGLTVPCVAKWTGLGNDCRNNEYGLLLNSDILDEASTNFLPFGDNFANELSYPVYKYLSPQDRAWESYVFFDINDVIEYQDGYVYASDGVKYPQAGHPDGQIEKYYETTSLKDLMLLKPYTDIFSKIIYSNSNDTNKVKNRSSLGYYNQFKESIDTFVSGLSLSMSVSNSAQHSINVKDLDNYRIGFISSPSLNTTGNEPFEVIINMNNKTMLMVWYQGADELNYNTRNSSIWNGKSILTHTHKSGWGGSFDALDYGNERYSYIKSPYNIVTDTVTTSIRDLYDVSTNYGTEVAKYTSQSSFNKGSLKHTEFNAYSDSNWVISNVFNIFDNLSYNTFNGNVKYLYKKSLGTYGSYTLNDTFSYSNNENIYRENTCSLEHFEYIIKNNRVNYTIINEKVIKTNVNFSGEKPFSIVINDPKEYKNIYVHHGWYKPKFNDILNFSYNESSYVINSSQLDFILGNTNLTGSNDIKQYWYKNVVDSITEEDVAVKNAISYKDGLNVFSSLWDKNYFMKDDTETNGFKSSLEKSSFFGSKLINLPESLSLDTWSTLTSSYEETDAYNKLKFNLSRQIINLFNINTVFRSNWSSLNISASDIENYIKDTILTYYIIDINKIEVKVWTKPFDGTRLHFSNDGDFEINSESNINGVLSFSNNEHIYNIEAGKTPDFSYFIEFKLFEK